MFRDKLGQLQVHVCLGVVLVTLLLHVATAQPLVNGTPANNTYIILAIIIMVVSIYDHFSVVAGGGSKGGEEPATGDDNRKSIANMNPNSR